MVTPLSVSAHITLCYGHATLCPCPHNILSVSTPVYGHATFCVCPHLYMATPHFVCVHTPHLHHRLPLARFRNKLGELCTQARSMLTDNCLRKRKNLYVAYKLWFE